MKRLIIPFLIAVMLSLACGGTFEAYPSAEGLTATPMAPGTPQPVPPEFQAMADELGRELGSFEEMLDWEPEPEENPARIAAELAFANGNLGEGLLQSGVRELNLLLLDRLQSLGVQVVLISVPFPLLDPAFPRSSEYLEFYKDTVEQVRRSGLKVAMKSGSIFSGTAFSAATVDWSAYSAESFLQGRGDQIVRMAAEFRPDYLVIANEPGTEMMLTGLTFTPAEWGAFLAGTAGRIDRTGGMAIGAGIGNWEESSFFDQVMRVGEIDFFDLHIYPMGENAVLLEQGLRYLREARAGGKRTTISESWLFKVDPRAGASAYGDYAGAINRDVYGFWQPLDARFIRDTVRMADATGTEFVSFFWTRSFFAYLDYDATPKNLSTGNINMLIHEAFMANVRKRMHSTLGDWFMEYLRDRRGE